MELSLILFALSALITPIVATPLKLADGYILPQIAVATIGISLSTVFFLSSNTILFSYTSLLAIIYFIYFMINNSWSTVPHNSVKDVPLIFLSTFALILGSNFFILDKVNIVLICLAVFCSAEAIAIYAIGQSYGIDFIFPERVVPNKDYFAGRTEDQIPHQFRNKDYRDTRAIGTLGNTNFAAGYFVATLPFLTYLTFELNSFFILSFIPVIYAVWRAKARAGLLGLFCSVLLFVYLISIDGVIGNYLYDILAKIDTLSLTLTFIPIILFIAHFVIILLNTKIIRELKEDNPLNNFLDIEETHGDHWIAHLRYRFRYWRAAIYLIKNRFLQGYGLRTYRKEVYEAQSYLNMKDNGKFLGKNYITPQPRECHNDYLENFVEGGFVAGFLFIFIIGYVIFNAYNSINPENYWLVISLISSLVAALVNAFFFFPFRLASSGLLFWLSLGLIEVVSGSFATTGFGNSVFLSIIVFLILLNMFLEGCIKPNLANFYFTKYNFAKYAWNKEYYLQKALKLQPRDTIFRTHASISYLNTFPKEADDNASIMREHYDGMTPAWIMYFNAAITKATLKCYDSACSFLIKAHNTYPAFTNALAYYNKLQPLAPLERRQVILKKMTDEVATLLRNYQDQLNGLNVQANQKIKQIQEEVMKSADSINKDIINTILAEKVKNNIPYDWPVNLETGQFFAPNEISPEMQVLEIGQVKMPIVVNRNIIQQQQNGERQ